MGLLGPIGLSLTILTTLKPPKNITILNIDKKISKFRFTLNNGEIVS